MLCRGGIENRPGALPACQLKRGGHGVERSLELEKHVSGATERSEISRRERVIGSGSHNDCVLAALIHRFATPQVARLGRLGDSHNFVDVSRHEGAIAPPHIAIWRPTEPLFFANAERIFASIGTGTRDETGIWAIVLSLEESFDLDSTALEALIEFDNAMRRLDIRVQLARAHDHVRDLLARSPETDLQKRCSFSVDDAVAALQPLIADLEKQR